MKIPKFLFTIFLLNISTICVCTKLPTEIVYSSPPNEEKDGGQAIGKSAILNEENNFDDILNYDLEEFSRIIESIDKDNENQKKATEKMSQQFSQVDHKFVPPSKLNEVCNFKFELAPELEISLENLIMNMFWRNIFSRILNNFFRIVKKFSITFKMI